MTKEHVLQALANAIEVQQPEEGLILHTDLGSQYTSEDSEKAVKEANIKQSFSRKGCPYDNACIESFHEILKKEEVYQTSYIDFKSARLALFHYIESWYNRKRIYLISSGSLAFRFTLPTHFFGRHPWLVFPVSSESC